MIVVDGHAENQPSAWFPWICSISPVLMAKPEYKIIINDPSLTNCKELNNFPKVSAI